MPPGSDQDKRQLGHSPVDAATELRFALVADWVSPSLARERLRAWLRRHQWSPEQVDDLVLVVSEAVSNSVEHGYGIDPEHAPVTDTDQGSIEVRCRIVTGRAGERRAELTIGDHGRWRPPATGPSNRGKGIRLMLGCGERVVFSHNDSGSTVVVFGHPIPGH